ncbi:sugar phosphate isomerase/epimerase family protein [Litorivivens sp.]|uniref:sugar phosphate isomerase/epimerase family protein n=1 Tax=Litorivivens sp. TaxID=2020868 RepID=UPI003568ECD7
MKIGMNLFLWTTRVTEQHFPLIEHLANSGFDLIELPNAEYSRHEINALRGHLDQLGLARTVATLCQEETNPIANNPQVRQRALEQLQREIDLTAQLGGEALIGPIHSAHKVFSGQGQSDTEFGYCVEFLRTAGEYAQSAGIELSVEFLNRFECYFLNTSKQAQSLVNAVALDNVGVLYDTHHAQIEERNQYDALSESIGCINQIHVSESHRGTPGTGTVDWSGVFSALNQHHYNGRIVIEAFGNTVPDIVSAVNIWRNNFSCEEEVYREGLALIQSKLSY